MVNITVKGKMKVAKQKKVVINVKVNTYLSADLISHLRIKTQLETGIKKRLHEMMT